MTGCLYKRTRLSSRVGAGFSSDRHVTEDAQFGWHEQVAGGGAENADERQRGLIKE